MWLASNKGVVRTAELPGLPRSYTGPNPIETSIHAVAPPVLLVSLPWLNPRLWSEAPPRELLILSWATAVVICLPIGLWLGRRYRFPLPALAAWAVFLALCGVPGLLAFLSVQEWTARVACPSCKRPRLVDRQHCEHCGADFPPPDKTGTEVFAPLAPDLEEQRVR